MLMDSRSCVYMVSMLQHIISTAENWMNVYKQRHQTLEQCLTRGKEKTREVEADRGKHIDWVKEGGKVGEREGK